jgi:hypothetical protein
MSSFYLRPSPARFVVPATMTTRPGQASADRRFRLPLGLAARLDCEAEARGLTRADIIRTALETFLNDLEHA